MFWCADDDWVKHLFDNFGVYKLAAFVSKAWKSCQVALFLQYVIAGSGFLLTVYCKSLRAGAYYFMRDTILRLINHSKSVKWFVDFYLAWLLKARRELKLFDRDDMFLPLFSVTVKHCSMSMAVESLVALIKCSLLRGTTSSFIQNRV